MVVDTTRLCMRFIREVSRRIETQWPPSVVARYRTRDGADDADLGRWLAIRASSCS
jgi:hypothetical protein